MTKKQFNRDYMVRVRVKATQPCMREYNVLVGYDRLARLLGEKFDRVLIKVERACACKVVVKPYHGMEVTFIAH